MRVALLSRKKLPPGAGGRVCRWGVLEKALALARRAVEAGDGTATDGSMATVGSARK
jgi:hypothetical protein